MTRICSMLLVCVLLVGCGKSEQPIADVAKNTPPPPPTKLKYQPQFGPHDAQQRYTADKPFSGNDSTLPQNAPPTKNYVGTVRSVAGNSLTVSVNGQDMTFNVSPDVWVVTGNNPRNFQIKEGLAKVQAGNQVRVSTTTSGAGEMVTSMVVTTNGGDGND